MIRAIEATGVMIAMDGLIKAVTRITEVTRSATAATDLVTLARTTLRTTLLRTTLLLAAKPLEAKPLLEATHLEVTHLEVTRLPEAIPLLEAIRLLEAKPLLETIRLLEVTRLQDKRRRVILKTRRMEELRSQSHKSRRRAKALQRRNSTPSAL